MSKQKYKAKTASLRPYQCKTSALKGNRFLDVMPQARQIFRSLQKQTKRRPHIRSAYFHKDKIFFDYFWTHLQQKPPSERARRLKYFPCALELLRHTRHDPLTFEELEKPSVLLHRFAGKAPDGSLFYVQVKQDKRSGKKQCISIFPTSP